MLNKLPKLGKSPSKRLGRGLGSGRGKTAGRGTKGQKSRSGYNIPRRFEGGQMPWIQRLPKKRGFSSIKEKPQIVKLSILEKVFDKGIKINQKVLFEKGLIKSKSMPVKVSVDKKIESNFKYQQVILTKKMLLDIKKSQEQEKIEKVETVAPKPIKRAIKK